ncbi:hypothetical protein [Labrenzia sp. OB1]|uniref:capsular polysaccharide export protein, LipB/KpsS family n=1 Tax=Labrenzia sp. OB1 TaxID=1561204 RepID=UPI0008380FB2|nr:hypothetical protein [Labrenzia sp. OB1]
MLIKFAKQTVALCEDLISGKPDRLIVGPVKEGNKTLFFGFADWKHSFYQSVFQDKDIVFVGQKHYRNPKFIEAAFENIKNQDVYVWSYKDPYWLSALCAANNCTICRVEDGFLRSVGLGAQRISPLSIIVERNADLYFHKSRSSALHRLLRSLDVEQKAQFHDKGALLKQRILNNNLTKYNFKAHSRRIEIADNSVFVVGQVERDESIRRGPNPYITCEQLIERVRDENPGATVFFKQHPEVYKGIAEPYSAPFRRFPDIVEFPQDLNMFAYAKAFQRIYTISSLVGFEMLLRGATVTTFGAPWYSGWSLTDDRNVEKETVDDLTAEILLWAGYGQYPSYFDDLGQPSDVFSVTDRLSQQLRA